MASKVELTENEEMFLERLWCLKEMGRNKRRSLIGTHDCSTREKLLEHFQRRNFVTVASDEGVDFTSLAYPYAEGIIRRRRLTEVLLHNVLELTLNVVETSACKIEHIINEEVTDSICTFLGHPVQCPHGKPIPRGSCCRNREGRIKPLIEPLKNFAVGKKARVVFISAPEGGVLQRLTSLGLYPGAVVSVRQHKPTVILRAGETDIALDPAFIERIYCRSLSTADTPESSHE